MPGYWRPLWLCAALLFSAPMIAAEIDPPGRVGRISMANDGAQLRVGDSVVSGSAALNWPLSTGALIETVPDARTEARIGSSTLRLDGGSSLELAELGDERIWLRLHRGSVILGIPSPEHAAETVLDAPQGRMRFDAPGIYRIDASGGTSAFSAYSGSARIEEPDLTVRQGDRILLLGSADSGYVLGRAVIDAFRQWSQGREQLDVGGGKLYVSPEMTGHEELDRHGVWRETPEYGAAWYPQRLPIGWAPYRWGQWIWISPWGWTWVDQAPWGFAPFHYGRWALIGGTWAWVPGAYVARPVYAPALVVWLGQPGWSASFSFGSAPAVGWFPLGPREAYYPHYRSTPRHVRSINASHVQNADRMAPLPPHRVDAAYAHRYRNEAVTIVPQQTMLSGATVAPAAMAIRDKNGAASTTVASSPPQYLRASEKSHRPADLMQNGKTVQPIPSDAPVPAKPDSHRQWQEKSPPPNRTAPAMIQNRNVVKSDEGNAVGHPQAVTPPISPVLPSDRQLPRDAGKQHVTRPSTGGDHNPAGDSHSDRPHRMMGGEKAKEAVSRENPRTKQNRMDP